MSKQSFSGLDPVFIGKPTKRIKRKSRKTTGDYWTLPFVDSPYLRSTAPDWNVPATGGYFGGYETGSAMAVFFLKFLSYGGGDGAESRLSNIAESFMIRFEQLGGKAMRERERAKPICGAFDSLRGQYVGFFNTLSQWLIDALQGRGIRLDDQTEQDLLRCANEGLGFQMKEYMASLTDDESIVGAHDDD